MENEELKIYDQIKHAFEQYEYAVWLYDDKPKKQRPVVCGKLR